MIRSDVSAAILDSCAGIRLNLDSKTEADYQADELLAAAVERYLERICEAIRHMPSEIRSKHPQIQWRAIVDLGEALHDTTGETPSSEVWPIATTAIKPLEDLVRTLVDRPGN